MTSFRFYQGTSKPKGIGFLETFKNIIYYKIIIITARIIWRVKLKAKIKKYKFRELLILRLNKFISYQFLIILLEKPKHEQSLQNK